MPTQTALNKAATVVTPEDLTDLEQIEEEFETRMQKYYEDGRTYMMAQFTRMLGGIKSEKKRISARFDREVMAAHRKALVEMKANAKNGQSNP